MANVFVENSCLVDIANAIRTKLATEDQMLPAEMAEKILSISQSDPVQKYVKLDYIDADGVQYIDTGFRPNQDTRIDIEYQSNNTISAAIVGADATWAVDAFCLYTSVAEYGSATSAVTMYGSSIISASFDKNVIYKNGYAAATLTKSTFQCPCNAIIFGCNRSGEARELTTGRIYSCQIYDNGTLVRDFIPCVDVSSGEIGMWDLVGDKFHGNSGIGTFGGHIVIT